MEKLTWLATERRLSQEGDSEEENSQEENSEPEEEEEEEGEGIESSQKDDEVCGDVSEEPKSAFTLTNMAPQVEAHRMPPGKLCQFLLRQAWGNTTAACMESDKWGQCVTSLPS